MSETEINLVNDSLAKNIKLSELHSSSLGCSTKMNLKKKCINSGNHSTISNRRTYSKKSSQRHVADV